MAQPPSRSIIMMIINNFINSIKPRQIRGTLIGKDYFGNKYYEIPADPSIGKRRTNRWFEPTMKDNFDQEMPAEWEAWLRGRRKLPPSEDEVMKSVALMEMKKHNAIEVDAKGGKMTPMAKGMETFPHRPDYERIPVVGLYKMHQRRTNKCKRKNIVFSFCSANANQQKKKPAFNVRNRFNFKDSPNICCDYQQEFA